MIKNYLKQGKPLVGIGTANHAFSLCEPVASGHEAWAEFVPEILGCENTGCSREDLERKCQWCPMRRIILFGKGLSYPDGTGR
jgi:hypothetical protein